MAKDVAYHLFLMTLFQNLISNSLKQLLRLSYFCTYILRQEKIISCIITPGKLIAGNNH